MNKLFLTALILITLSFTLVSAKDAALVVKSSGSQNIIQALNETGYSYDVIPDSAIASTNFSSYGIILVQESVTNYDKIPAGRNILFLDKSLVSRIWGSGWKYYSTAGSAGMIKQGVFPFTEGFANNTKYNVYSASKTQYYARKVSSTGAVVYGIIYPTGTSSQLYPTVAYSSNSSSRSVFFGLTDSDFWTNDTKKLFRNSLRWVRKGVDLDGDGFYSGDDCNDNNVAINPNATEVAYNSIDENCDGYDLADVDGDGWCKQGYIIQNKFLQCVKEIGNVGTDCNDDNLNINPNATEIIDSIDQNCRNDAPVFSGNILNQTWNEDAVLTDSINLSNYFSDYEGNALNFSVYATSPDKNITVYINNGMISFSSSQNWNGDDWIIFKAIDSGGAFNISNKVSLKVLPVNDAPYFTNLNNISMIEGQKAVINANANDVDSVNLIYSINDLRFIRNGSNFEWQTNIGNAGTYYAKVSVSDGNLSVSQEIKIKVLQKIIINEFASQISGNDWVEIYNAGNSIFDLTGCYLEDSGYNHLNVHGNIAGKSYFVAEWSDKLNNDTDTIKLYCDGIIDYVSYGGAGNVSAPETGESAGRISDGLDTDLISDWKIYSYPTKGTSNLADMTPPRVNLISPVNNSVITELWTIPLIRANNLGILQIENSEMKVLQLTEFSITEGRIYFNYTASDNKDLNLNCSFYSDILNKTFKLLANQTIANGSQANFWANDTLNGNYKWQVKCKDVSGNIGESEIRNFRINVPEAPVIQPIANILVNETGKARIVVNATDSNEDALTYWVNDSRFIKNGNLFEWQTDYSDAGIYYVLISVSDGLFNSNATVRVEVRKSNRKPVMESIENQTIDEDGSKIIILNASDADGDNIMFRVKQETGDIKCLIMGNNLTIIPAKDWNGDASCLIEASDGIDIDEKIVNIKILAVNDAPEILSYSPIVVPVLADEGTQKIAVVWKDIDNNASEINIEWFVNNVSAGFGSEFVYHASGKSEESVRVRVSDSESYAEHEWTVRTSSIPIANSYDGQTTDFEGMNDSQLANVNLVLEKSAFGKVEMSNVDLRNAVDFDSYADIQRGLVSLDSGYFSSLAGKIAKITLRGLGFVKMPVIYYNSGFTTDRNQITNTCPENMCTNASYNGGTLTFYSHFTSFKIGDTLSCSQQFGNVCSASEVCAGNLLNAVEDRCCSSVCMPKFSDADKCRNISAVVSMEIRKPSEGEKFKIGESIPVKINIDNNGNDDLSMDVSAYLYDLTTDKSIADASDSVDVEFGNQEKLDLEIEIPSDADESDEFAVFVMAEDGACVQDYRKIEIERDKHDISLTGIDFPDYVNCNDNAEASVSVENLGESGEDITLRIVNSELNISEKSSFSLKKSGKDGDSGTKRISVHIPDYTAEKSYTLEVRASYSGASEALKKDFYVNCDKEQTATISSSEAVRLNAAVLNVQVEKKGILERINSLRFGDMVLLVFNVFLILGIILIVVWIIARRK